MTAGNRPRLAAVLLAGAFGPLSWAAAPVHARGPLPWKDFDRLLDRAKRTAPQRPASRVPAVTEADFPARLASLDPELERDADEAGRLAAALEGLAARCAGEDPPAGVEVFGVMNDVASLRERLSAALAETRALNAFALSRPSPAPLRTPESAEELRAAFRALDSAAGQSGPALESLGSQAYAWSRRLRADAETALKAAEDLLGLFHR